MWKKSGAWFYKEMPEYVRPSESGTDQRSLSFIHSTITWKCFYLNLSQLHLVPNRLFLKKNIARGTYCTLCRLSPQKSRSSGTWNQRGYGNEEESSDENNEQATNSDRLSARNSCQGRRSPLNASAPSSRRQLPAPPDQQRLALFIHTLHTLLNVASN